MNEREPRGRARKRKPGEDEKPPKAKKVGDVLASVLKNAGVSERIEQAAIIPDWPKLVGPQIAKVTTPRVVTADGTLFVGVTTHAWMSELSLMEPELLKRLNASEGRAKIKKIRWETMR